MFSYHGVQSPGIQFSAPGVQHRVLSHRMFTTGWYITSSNLRYVYQFSSVHHRVFTPKFSPPGVQCSISGCSSVFQSVHHRVFIPPPPQYINLRLCTTQVIPTGCSPPGVHHRVFTTGCSQPGVHHRVFTTGCSLPGVYHRAFTTGCSPPGVYCFPDVYAGRLFRSSRDDTGSEDVSTRRQELERPDREPAGAAWSGFVDGRGTKDGAQARRTSQGDQRQLCL